MGEQLHPSVSLVSDEPNGYEKPIHHILPLDSHWDEETQTKYQLYVQPYNEWNQYGVLDPSNLKRTIVEVYSMVNSRPCIEIWWNSTVSAERFLQSVNMFLDKMSPHLSKNDESHVSIFTPNVDYPHAPLFTVQRPFDIFELEKLQKLYYQKNDLEQNERYRWPFSIDESSLISLLIGNIGELKYDKLNKVIGTSMQKNMYTTHLDTTMDALYSHSENTGLILPEGILEKLFDHVVVDPYQL